MVSSETETRVRSPRVHLTGVHQDERARGTHSHLTPTPVLQAAALYEADRVSLVHVWRELVTGEGHGDEVDAERQVGSPQRDTGPRIQWWERADHGATNTGRRRDAFRTRRPHGSLTSLGMSFAREWISAGAWCLPLACTSPLPSTPAAPPIVLSHVTVIDGNGGARREAVTIVIRDGRIIAVTEDSLAEPPAGARVIDAMGKFLIPGLWDMHVHTSWDRHFTMPLMIANGVTGVREMFGSDMGAIRRARGDIDAGRLLGPRIIAAGPIIDGPGAVWPGSIVVHTAEEAREAVARVQREGADFVKVYSSLDREAYFAILAEARRRGLPVAGHVPRAVTLAEASDSGQRSVEHLLGMDELVRFESTQADSVFELLRRNGTWQTPTLAVLRVASNPNDPALSRAASLRFVPYALRGLWSLLRRSAGDAAPAEAERRRDVFARQLRLVGRLAENGVPLLVGTDTPNAYTIPGFSVHDELAFLVRAGLTPMAALQAATREPARFLGLQDSVGTVTPGQVADLVLLDANPLVDIRNTRRISAVIRSGRYLSRSDLDRALAGVQRSRWRPSVAAVTLAGAIVRRLPIFVLLLFGGLVLGVPVAIVLLVRRWRRRRVRLNAA